MLGRVRRRILDHCKSGRICLCDTNYWLMSREARMIRLRDHYRAAAASMILAAGLLSAAVAVPMSAAQDPSPPGGLPGIQVPSLSWKSCTSGDNGFQCATAQVPRDYRNLGSGSLSLNVK